MPYVPQVWSPEPLLARRRAARLAPYEPLLLVAAAVAGGVTLDRFVELAAGWPLLAVLAWLVWLLLWRRGAVVCSSIALLVVLFAAGGGWHHCRWRLFDEADLGAFAQPIGAPVCIDAIALESPTRRAAPEFSPYRAIPGVETSRVVLKVIGLRDGMLWRAAHGECQLTVDGHLLGVAAGDRVRVFGQLSRLPPAMNPREFDYAADQQARRRLCSLRCESPDCVSLLASGSAVSVSRLLDNVRSWGERTLIERLGPQNGELAAAMIIGAQDRLPRKTVETFRHAGSLHVLVVSGLHVGLVISGFYLFARMGWAPRRWSLLTVMIAIAVYMLVTGARPPVLRAAVLAELMCFALWSGRTVLAFNSLGAAAVVVLACNPCELFRTGAQLSFLAAATLIWFGRQRLEREANRDPMTRLLRSVESPAAKGFRYALSGAGAVFLATVVVWAVAAPLMMYRYHLLSPVAMPLAVLVFPLVFVSVISGLLVLVAEFALPWAAPAVAVVSRAGCGSLDAVMELGEATPVLGHFYLPGPALWWVLSAYLLMFVALRYGGRTRARRPLVYAALLLSLAGVGPPAWAAVRRPADDAPLVCTFISVGHGVSVLVEPPQGGAVLYDAGSLGSPWTAAERISAVLWSKGITRLDAVFLSHPDVDHFGALPTLLERFRVDRVLTSNQMFPRTLLPDEHTAPAELLRLLNARHVPIHRLALGDNVQLAGATVEVLHPTSLGVVDSDNANSLVLGVEHAGRRILLPGDLEGRGLEELLAQEPYDCDVLLAPHHGSPRSDPPGFAAWCRPEWVVISSAAGVYSDEAGQRYQSAGAAVLATSQVGAVQAVVDSRGVKLSTFLSPEETLARSCD